MVTDSGYPYTMSNFLCDNGLGSNLAPILMRDNHRVVIIDANTPEMVSRYVPADYKIALKSLKEKGDENSFGLVRRELAKKQEDAIPNIARERAVQIEEHEPDIVGFKLWSGDGTALSIEAAKLLRERKPDTLIIGGGPQVDLFRELILKKSDNAFDALVYGDGEYSLRNIANAALEIRKEGGKLEGIVNSFSRIPNLIYNNGKEIVTTRAERVDDLGLLEFPTAYGETYVSATKIRGIIVIEDGKGCSYGECVFCTHPNKSGKSLRTKSEKRIVDEMEYVYSNYGSRIFKLANSVTPPSLALGISKEILERGLEGEFEWTMFRRADKNLEPSFYRTLYKGGCRAIFFGLESGDQHILDLMNKGINVDTAKREIEECRKSGIYTIASVMVPAIGDTEHSRKKTFEAAKIADSVLVQPEGVFPNTKLANDPKSYGVEIEENYLEKFMNYKITPLIPMNYWGEFPFTYDRRTFREIAEITTAFIRDLNKIGIYQIPDDMYEMAKHCGIKPQKFASMTTDYFLTGDDAGLIGLCEEINENISAKKYFH